MPQTNDQPDPHRHKASVGHPEGAGGFARTIKCAVTHCFATQSRLHDSRHCQIGPQSPAKHEMQTIVRLGGSEKCVRPQIDTVSGAHGRHRGSAERHQTFVCSNEEEHWIGVTKGRALFGIWFVLVWT